MPTVSEWIAGAAIFGVCAAGPLACKSGDRTGGPASSKSEDKTAPGACKPGKTGRIAFLLKQQTAFRFLHADAPFFRKAIEAAGFKAVLQSAENYPQAQAAPPETALTPSLDPISL